MALFGRDHDREFNRWGGGWNRGYDRDHRFGWEGPDRDRLYRGMERYEPEMRATRYDRDFGASGYDREHKSRWQRDFGDPFGDRAARTPIRVIRGRPRSGYDQGYHGSERDRHEHHRDHLQAEPTGYDPYARREGTWMRGDDRSYRTYRRRYDTGWF